MYNVCVLFENGLGEQCEEQLYAEFTDETGQQWVVTSHWRERTPTVRAREDVQFIRHAVI